MGLSNHLCDLSGHSIPIVLVAAAASWLSFLRSVHLHRPAVAGFEAVAPPCVAGGLAKLIAFVEQLKACPPVAHLSNGEKEAVCVVCLCGMRTGEKVRRLACCHVFHGECLDGWIIGRSNPSCPLCRSPMVAEKRSSAVERRVAAELLPWFSRY